MTYVDFLAKIDCGYDFSKDELEELFYDFDGEVILEEKGDNRRWFYTQTNIVKVGNRFFAISADIGLTENHENEFYEQPFEVEVKTIEKLVTEITWTKKGV